MTRAYGDKDFWARVDRSGECWIWTGARTTAGYGHLNRAGGRSYQAHRYTYEAFIGPIPEGMQLDHLCRNRLCVRPRHLEPVTQRENMRRGAAPQWVAHRTDTCQRGIHPLVGENVKWSKTGLRRCRACENEQARIRRAARAA